MTNQAPFSSTKNTQDFGPFFQPHVCVLISLRTTCLQRTNQMNGRLLEKHFSLRGGELLDKSKMITVAQVKQFRLFILPKAPNMFESMCDVIKSVPCRKRFGALIE